jgi:hypothetical protein
LAEDRPAFSAGTGTPATLVAMNDSASSEVRRRAAIAVMAAAALALLAAACGGGSPGNHVAKLGTHTAQSTGALAFSTCMRANGVSKYPDPTSSGALVKESLQQLGVSTSRFLSAQSACRHLLPNGGSGPTAAELQQNRAQALKYAQCIRAHGVPSFPDPAGDGRIPDPATAGIDQGSPRFETANRACGRYRPPYMPTNAAYNAWARANGQ